jgi:hypothetical protein
MKTIFEIKKISVLCLLFASLFITNCNSEEDTPPTENEEEVITEVKLIFTNNANSSDKVQVSAIDADGPGVGELTVAGPITLNTNKNYTLTYEILNGTESIKTEIEGEKEDHQFFYSFSTDAFSNPMGNGNIDNSADAINYVDKDANNRNVGLQTTWTTGGSTLSSGSFKIQLQHQPDGIKTNSSGSDDGETDFELNFVLNIINPPA